MSQRPRISEESYEALVERVAAYRDEPVVAVANGVGVDELIDQLVDAHDDYREAAIAWQRKAEQLESADGSESGTEGTPEQKQQ